MVLARSVNGATEKLADAVLAAARTKSPVATASISLDFSYVENAAVTLVVMVTLQTVLCFVYIFVRENKQLALLKDHIPLAIFVGLTSALGSVGWFTAMTLVNATYVRALGQVELIFTFLTSILFFKEKITLNEVLGTLLIVGGLLFLLLDF